MIASLRPSIIALQFLTRLPTPALEDIQEREFGASMAYYPWVGLLLGIIFALLILLTTTVLSHGVLSALLLILWVFVTGGLHLDGLADSADAWIGGYGNREKTLSIMKDPTCGPIAVAVVVLTLLLKYSALVELISVGALTAIIAVPIVARAAALLLFLTTDYVREAGLGSAIKKFLPQRLAYAHLLFSFLLVLYLVWGKGITLLLIVLITYYGLRQLMINRLGGTTGDTAGAMIEIIETVALVALTLG